MNSVKIVGGLKQELKLIKDKYEKRDEENRNSMEVIGGLKQELKLIKEEYQENDANNVVEIGLEDIIDEGQDSSKENKASDDEAIWKKVEDSSTQATNEDKVGTVEKQHTNHETVKIKNEKEVLYINFQDIANNQQRNGNTASLFFHQGNRKINQCPHCPFKSKNRIKNHILCAHTDPDQIEWFYCHQCDYKCKIKTWLLPHILNVHTDSLRCNMKKCNRCDKQFKSTQGLYLHTKVHEKTVGKQLKCEFCIYTTHFKRYLNKHVKANHTDLTKLESLKCDKCSYTTKLKDRFVQHRRAHKEKKWQCHICSYQARDTERLELHLIYHKKEKKEEDLKYKCSECSYKTYRPNNLAIHKIKHKRPEDIQYFECFHCGFKANRKDNLKVHIARHDKKKVVQHQCFICEFQTQSKVVFVSHIDKHSKNDKKQFRLLQNLLPS